MLAGYDVLKRAHDIFGFEFTYMDFERTPSLRSPGKNGTDAQGVLPFLKTVRQDDIQIVGTKPVERDTLELTVQIRFTG